jgi:hypothetical protein
MALRRVRPPHPIQVALRAMKPVAFRDGDSRFEITAAYGPWRTSGCWWSQRWMGYGRVGCNGRKREWRGVRLPARSGPAAERVAAGGVL